MPVTGLALELGQFGEDSCSLQLSWERQIFAVATVRLLHHIFSNLPVRVPLADLHSCLALLKSFKVPLQLWWSRLHTIRTIHLTVSSGGCY